MSKYLGRDVTYGLFEKQILTPDGVSNEFLLSYQVGSVGSLLVSYSGVIQEPGEDFSISDGGTKIVFDFVPQVGFPLWLTYMGKEMQVPSVAGNYPQLVQFVAGGTTVDFILPVSPLTVAGIIVFKDGIQQRATDEFTLLGDTVTFLVAPANGAKLDFYILGIERTDLSTVDPLSITNDKIANYSVTSEKMNLLYDSYSLVLNTFGGMIIDSQTIHESSFVDTGQCIKLRVHFTVTLSGSQDNKIRFNIPLPNNGSTNVSGSVTLSSATSLENGIIRWGGANVFDVHRQFGSLYDADPTEWTVEVNMEYESA